MIEYKYQTSLSAVIGFMVSTLRSASGMNLRDFSYLMRTTHSTVAHIEKGESLVTSEFLLLFFNLIGSSLTEGSQVIDLALSRLEGQGVEIVGTTVLIKRMDDPAMDNIITGSKFGMFLDQSFMLEVYKLIKVRPSDLLVSLKANTVITDGVVVVGLPVVFAAGVAASPLALLAAGFSLFKSLNK